MVSLHDMRSILPKLRVVIKIFGWIGKERLSIGEVARRLQSEGIKTKTGKTTWDRSVIWGLLQNPAYMGKAAFGKTKVGPLLPSIRPQKHSNEVPKKTNSIYRQPKEAWIEIMVPALISEVLFQAVQAQLEENRKLARQRRRGAAYLLQGLVVCGHCHYAYYGKSVALVRPKESRVMRTTAVLVLMPMPIVLEGSVSVQTRNFERAYSMRSYGNKLMTF